MAAKSDVVHCFTIDISTNSEHTKTKTAKKNKTQTNKYKTPAAHAAETLETGRDRASQK
jgi:hypothetical protein